MSWYSDEEIRTNYNNRNKLISLNPSNNKQYLNMENDSESLNRQLSIIFKEKNNKFNTLANRRDVINKAILRGFKKFFVDLLKSCNPQKKAFSKNLKPLSRTNVLTAAKDFGILNLKPTQDLDDEFEDLIYWLSFPKITKKVMNLTKDANSSIAILYEVLSNYTHHKLELVFKNKNIMALFGYFNRNVKDRFIYKIWVSKKNQTCIEKLNKM